MSRPLPEPRASSSLARCQAVERPCMPAPMITYRVWAGLLTARCLLCLPGGDHPPGPPRSDLLKATGWGHTPRSLRSCPGCSRGTNALTCPDSTESSDDHALATLATREC